MSAGSRGLSRWFLLFLTFFFVASVFHDNSAEAARRRGRRLFGRRRVAQSFRNRRAFGRRRFAQNFNRFGNFGNSGNFGNFGNFGLGQDFNNPFFLNQLSNFNFSRGVPLDPNFQAAQLAGAGGFGFNGGLGFNAGLGGVYGNGFGGGFGGFGNGFNNGFNQGFVSPQGLRIVASNGGAFAIGGNGQAFEVDPRFLGANGQLADPSALAAFYSGDVNRLKEAGVFRQELFRTKTDATDQIIPAFGKQGDTLPQTQAAIKAYQSGSGDGQGFTQ